MPATTKLLPEELNPPFTFVYDKRLSRDLLPAWKCEVNAGRADEQCQEHEVVYTDPKTGLELHCEVAVFKDFPAVEWLLRFRNTSGVDTPILEDIEALDGILAASRDDPAIHYARGAANSLSDFMPMTRILGDRDELRLQPGAGRSSSLFLPFFNIETEKEGAVLAVGWTGEWAATFTHPPGTQHFRVRAGMALTHLRLHPGEEIRTPRMLILFWQGERTRGHNLLRRFILHHHRPRCDGKPLEAPIANASWGGTPAARHLGNVRQIIAHNLPMDYYWIDAEWFGKGEWGDNAGNWEPKKDLYPDGIKPISDLLHSSGRKLLLWFEPERVCEGTPWYTEHADWLLAVPKDKRMYRGFGAKGDWDVAVTDPRWIPNESSRNQIREGDRLFNLGNPDARQFLTDFISRKIDEFGLDCFRNDSNIAPLEFWRAADAPDRQGITEIRWIEGLYAFWDELLRRHPGLIIDNCASGGRRMDLETIGRSTPLYRTDFPWSPLSGQCHSYGLLRWVPLNSTITGGLTTHSEYFIRSSMTAGIVYDLFSQGDQPQGEIDYTSYSFEAVRKSMERYRGIQKYFYGDFYPLTEYTQTRDAWLAYQLDLPETSEGIMVVLKREASNYIQAAFPLKALQSEAYYELTNLDTDEKRTISGSELMSKGPSARLPNQPDSALFRYRRKR